MAKGFRSLYLAIAAGLAAIIWASAFADDTYTVLGYDEEQDVLTGYSVTEIFPAEPYTMECTLWTLGYDPYFNEWFEMCSQAIAYVPSASTTGQLDGPNGTVFSGSQFSQQTYSAIPYPPISEPAGGNWWASANHYFVNDTYLCEVVWAGWGGYYYPGSCWYIWSDQIFMGATQAAAAVNPKCRVEQMTEIFDQSMSAQVRTIGPPRPYERAFTGRCTYISPQIGQFTYTHYNDSFGEEYPGYQGTIADDPCVSQVAGLHTDGTTAHAHTHPYFEEPEDYTAHHGCFGAVYTPTQEFIDQTNIQNQNFSTGDHQVFNCLRSPGYLLTPLGDTVLKLQGSTSPGCPNSTSMVYP